MVFTLAVLGETHSKSALAYSLTAQVVGRLIALLIAGPVIDRVERRRFLVSMQLATAVVWCTLSLTLALRESEVVVYSALGFLLGVCSGLNGPATQSVLVHLVPPEDVKPRLAELRIALNTLAILGPTLAGVALGLVPPWIVVLVLAGANLASGVQLRRLPLLKIERAPARGVRSYFRNLRPLLQPWFVIAVAATSAMNVIWAGYYQVNGPTVLADSGKFGSLAWGATSGALGAGLILGGIVFRTFDFNRPRATPLAALAGKSLPLLVLGLNPTVYLLAPATFIAGFLLEAFALNFYSQLQTTFRKDLVGTALSGDAFIGLLLTPLGYQLASWTDSPSTEATWQVAAAGATVVLAVGAWLGVRVAERN